MLKEDLWLSHIIGKASYTIPLENIDCYIEKEAPLEPSFITVKVPYEMKSYVEEFQMKGFIFIDANITLDVQTPIQYQYLDEMGINLRLATDSDSDFVRNIARDSFSKDRFHQDSFISQQSADSIKEKWAYNYFSGKRGDLMAVIEVDNEVAGFIQLIKKSSSETVIDLIAIDSRYRNKGLGKKLITFVSNKLLPEASKLTVSTQISNIESIKLYQSLGFSIDSSFYILHKHTG